MMQYPTAKTALGILCLILHISLTTETTLLRWSSTKEQPALQDALIKLQELEAITIPRLVENMARLQAIVSELEEHRRLTASCGFVLSTDGSTCQLNAPVALLSGVTVQGSNTKIMGNFTVEGNTVLKGGYTGILSSKVNMTGTTTIKDLIVGDRFEVLGESIFDSNIEVIHDAIMDHGLITKGHAHFHDLEVDDDLDIKGKTSLEDSVSIIGKHSSLHVYGDVTIEDKLTVEGDTVLQDVTEKGKLVFNNKVVFNDDVEMDKLQVQDLTIDGSCDGCV